MIRGQWVPPHLALSLEPHKAEALGRLLREVVSDDAFPLNELEQEIVDDLIELIESGPHTPVPQ